MELLINYREQLQALGYHKKTIYSKIRNIKTFIFFIQKREEEVKVEDVEKYLNYLKEKKLHTSTIYQYYRNIEEYFNYLHQNKNIKKNPLSFFIFHLEKQPYKQRNILSQKEIKELYSRTKNLKEKMILHLCYGCGLRALELERINVEDIDIINKWVIVQQGKNAKRRMIPINETLQKDFIKYIDRRNKIQTTEKALLLNDISTRLRKYTALDILKKLLKRAKIGKQITLHSLRHSIATHLLENGLKLESVKEFLGHKYLDTTEVYTRIIKPEL